MKSYRDLEVYKLSKGLAVQIHKISLSLPKFELYEAASQIRRSSKAVTNAIVEGYGRRRYKAEFIRYLIFAQSECDETMVHLDFLFETSTITNEKVYVELKDNYNSLSERVNKFIQWVDENFNLKQTGIQ